MRGWTVAWLCSVLPSGLAIPQTNSNNVNFVRPESSSRSSPNLNGGPPGNAPATTNPSSQNYCGFWLENQQTRWRFCSPSSCAIATYATPNVIFCPVNEGPPYTEYFAFGQWPQGGCRVLQWCCEKHEPNVVRYQVNGAATMMITCTSASRNEPTITQTMATQLGSLSARLSRYTAPFATSSSTSSRASAATSSPTGQPPPTANTAEKKDDGLSKADVIKIATSVPSAVLGCLGIAAFIYKRVKKRKR